MKITINKSAKRVLSLVLALAVLVGSLFVANAGVTFITNAATVEDTWDGSKVEPTATDSEGNIIISTAEELAWIALQGGTSTQDKNYKVVDNAVFNMNGMSGIKLDSTAAEVQAATKDTAKLWIAGTDYPFMGNFDGNGAIIYNINGNGAGSYGYAGLFPTAKQTADGDGITIKNIKVCASYFTAFHGVGAVIGYLNAPGTSCTGTLEGLSSENCYLSDNGSTNAAAHRTVANIVGLVGHTNLTMNNCFAKGNTLSAANIVGGLVGNTSAYSKGVAISNSIVIGTSPIPVELITTDDCPLQSAMSSATYTNVYTDQTVSQTGITTLTTVQMTGETATQNMALDFGSTWFANTAGVPELRAFHNIAAVDNEDGTHSETCADCGLVGLTVNHIYNIVDYTTNTSSCACGVFEFGTNDVWDGTEATAFDSGSGTKDDPYIIKTVEQLYKMVRDQGVMRDADGNKLDKDGNVIDEGDYDNEVAAYYKVADTVNALYINDTRSFEDKDAFVAAAASLNNWSKDVIRGVWCGDCGKEHPVGYPDSFAGNFDGNGVIVYGLYSMLADTTAYNSTLPGVGFFPGLTGNALVKNVTFDMSYVSNTKSRYVGVLTSSFGFPYTSAVQTNGTHEPQRFASHADITVSNVASRNVHIVTGDGSTGGSGTNTYASGIIAAGNQPAKLTMSNCLFDGSNATYSNTPASGTAYTAGIYATGTYEEPTSSIDNCLSIGAPVVITEIENADERSMGVINSYTTVSENKFYDSINVTSNYKTIANLPLLNWTMWDIDAVEEYGTPMPKVSAGWDTTGYVHSTGVYLSPHKQAATTHENEYDGYYWGALRHNEGIFDGYASLQGSGTEEDPYIISDTVTLYRVIASGGTHYGVPQYYKLDRNLDLGGTQWVDTELFKNTEFDVTFYQYVPFAGVLDGDGHTIYNLYSAASDYAGFIPELQGGTVKNLHFRNAYVASSESTAGIITGWMEGGSVTDCSVEDATVYSYGSYGDGLYVVYNDDIWDPDAFGTITDCYFIGKTGEGDDIAVYTTDTSDPEGDSKVTATIDEIKNEIVAGTTDKWYLGGDADSIPRLIENAKAQPCADIDADGLGEEYTTNDAVALKNNLLWEDGYDYIYGDVTGNNTIDMRDLAALQRQMTGQETIEIDGFWPNVKAGKFSIYYDEADNYDFARKLELYLESMAGVDVAKSMGTSDANYTINIKTSGDVSAYTSTYDKATAKLTISGGSFTAVEEAVDRVIAETSAFGLPAEVSGTIGTDKNAVTIDGSTYYYAWGDEFETAIDGTVSYDKWMLRNKGTDETPGTIDTEFEHIRPATDEEAKEINAISNGQLTLKRGFTGATTDTEHKFYMSGISTRESMMFKQGYLEMVAAVPSDGYAFPAWWLLTHGEQKDNRSIDDSLFSKVFELNENYDYSKAVRTPTPTDITTYKYKVPTQTLEMDLFEIIQRPTETWSWGSFSNVSAPSDDHNIKFNIHKWYTYSLDRTDTNLTVYDLDWANAGTSGAFTKTLLTASGATEGVGYTKDSASIEINTGNLSTGGVNGAATYQGGHATMQYDMADLRTNEQITSRKYGFLWTEDKMTFIVYTDATGTTELYRATVTVDDMNFGGSESYYNDNFGFNQYAYMLIENHIFTAQKNGSSWIEAAYDDIGECDLVIDYVRIYQLEGARAIITPESESIYNR